MVRRVLVPKIVTITNILLTQAIIDINVMVQIRTNPLPVVSSELFWEELDSITVCLSGIPVVYLVLKSNTKHCQSLSHSIRK